MRNFSRVILKLIITLLFVGCQYVWADTTKTLHANITKLSQNISAERSRIEATKNLSDDERDLTLTKLDQAANLVEQTIQLENQSNQLKSLIASAPAELTRLRKPSINKTLDSSTVKRWSQQQLTKALAKTIIEIDDANRLKETAERSLSEYIDAAQNGGAEISQISNQLSKLLSPSAINDKSLTNTDILLNQANSYTLSARLSLLKTQQSNLGILTELATAQRDTASLTISSLQKRLELIRSALAEKQNINLKTAQTIAENSVDSAMPELKSLQNKIIALLKEQSDLLTIKTTHEHRLDTLKQLLDELKSDRTRIQQAINIAGDNEHISDLLQKRLAAIPRISSLKKDIITYQNGLSNTFMRQLALNEILRDTRSATEFSAQLLASLPVETTENRRKELRKDAEVIWAQYHKVILELLKNYNSSIAVLSFLDSNTRQLLQVAGDFRLFISDNLLWMPSNGFMLLTQPKLLINGLEWLIEKQNLIQLLDDSKHTFWKKRSWGVIWALLLLALAFSYRRACNGLAITSAETAKPSKDNYAATFKAIGYTLILILPLPLLLFGSGLLLGNTTNVNEFTIKIAAGLQGSGQTLFFLLFLRQLCHKNGLAINHLGWHQVLCNKLRTQSDWLMPFAVPMAFLISASASGIPSDFIYLTGAAQVREPGLLALGGLSFVSLMILFSLAIHRIWRRNGPVLQKLASASDSKRWADYHLFWFIPALLLPLVFVATALLGYYYTAVFFLSLLGEMLLFFIILRLFRDLLLRRLYLTQRNLRIQEAKRARVALREAEKNTSAEQRNDTMPPVIEEEKIEYTALSEQVRQLVRTAYISGLIIGLWWICKDIIPALSFLDNVKLPITNTVLVEGVTKEVPLSLGSLIGGLIIGGLTLLAARSIPGLLEFTLLQRLPITQASRYAITTLTQYTVVMIGLVISLNSIGLQWSSIQWLVAALSVGLGFGLQEIVANFVSGVILLFEQPIRIGDVVTISGMQGNAAEGISGTVSRIRIRATTIILWGREEVVVPNKTFITSQLTNWTLSNNITRVIIPVGVAYGSDVEKAMRLMLEIAAEHPDILDDPEPRASFEGFGDNSLNLFLRIYLNDIGLRVSTMTDVCLSINKKFNEADIVIAFPQRDIHFDNNQPLELVMRREPARK